MESPGVHIRACIPDPVRNRPAHGTMLATSICYCILTNAGRKRMLMHLVPNTRRRTFLTALAALSLSVFSAGVAMAVYPERIVRIVVPFAPGGGTDVVARTLAQDMAKDLGVTVMIENKPGAGYHYRDPGRRHQRAGWLYAADGNLLARGQSKSQCKAAL
jgi:hypothetical protein